MLSSERPSCRRAARACRPSPGGRRRAGTSASPRRRSRAGARLHRVADHARVLEGELDDAVGRANAASVAASSPATQSKDRFPGSSAWSCAAPGASALSAAVTAGSSRLLDRDQLGRVLRELRPIRRPRRRCTRRRGGLPLREHRPRRLPERLAEAVLDAEVGRDRLCSRLPPRSRPVSTASTPGASSALPASTETISACARSERRNAA